MQTFISKGKRKRYLTGFHNCLNKKLAGIGFKCVLKVVSNWISGKDSLFFWKGKYICCEPSCKINFDATIENKDIKIGKFIVALSWDKLCTHEIFKPLTMRITGNERKKVGLKIISVGLANFKATDSINHFNSADIGKYF
jgi:hypothetical protein